VRQTDHSGGGTVANDSLRLRERPEAKWQSPRRALSEGGVSTTTADETLDERVAAAALALPKGMTARGRAGRVSRRFRAVWREGTRRCSQPISDGVTATR
jgi:hypothetical protein